MKDGLKSKQFIAGSCYSYILSSSGEALIIDPHISLLDEYSEYLNARNLNLKYINEYKMKKRNMFFRGRLYIL